MEIVLKVTLPSRYKICKELRRTLQHTHLWPSPVESTNKRKLRSYIPSKNQISQFLGVIQSNRPAKKSKKPHICAAYKCKSTGLLSARKWQRTLIHLNKVCHFRTHVIISLSNRHDKTNVAHCQLLSCQ